MFRIEVKVRDNDHKDKWVQIRPTYGDPYNFNTYQEAHDMMAMCYPEQDEGKEVRVVEVKKNS